METKGKIFTGEILKKLCFINTLKETCLAKYILRELMSCAIVCNNFNVRRDRLLFLLYIKIYSANKPKFQVEVSHPKEIRSVTCNPSIF